MIATSIAAYALFLTPQGELQDIWERLSFHANGRLRAESTIDQLSGKDRHRGRVRFRIGAGYEIIDTLRVDARLTTASDGKDSNNPYWEFGDGSDDGFQGIETVFDRFFLTWTPKETLDLRCGKLPHVFSSPPVYGEFVWDDDVHPAGITAIWAPETEGSWRGDLRLAEYVVTENSSDDDANMLGVQANIAVDVGEDTTLAAASGMQWWTSLDDGAFENQGNTTTGGLIDEDFTVWESYLSARHEGGPLQRQQGFVQYMTNVDDDSGEDQGFTLGLELGTRDPGRASFFAAWYDVDANAIFSPVAQDDTPIPGTGSGDGMTGVLGGFRYVVNDRLSFRLWGLTSDADDVEDPWRLRFDIDFNVR
jgi:hypothetical protein